MEGTYDVMLAGEKMGTVEMKRQGLYWYFSCRCSLSGEVMYYLAVQLGEKMERLGLLVPEGDAFCLQTRVPAKRLCQGIPLFTLQPKHAPVGTEFVPVRAEEPFAYLHRLQESHLAIRNGKIGLAVPVEK